MAILQVNLAINTDDLKRDFRETITQETLSVLEKVFKRVELERPDLKLVVPESRILVP